MNAIEIPFGNKTERRMGLVVQEGAFLLGAAMMFLAYRDGHLAAMYVGPVVAVVGLAGGGAWRFKARLRRLVVEHQGLRWEEKGTTWSVPWYELAGVALARTTEPKPSLWLHLEPRDPQAFATTYRSVPTTAQGHWIRLPDDLGGEMLDLALRRFAPQLYRGLVPHFTG